MLRRIRILQAELELKRGGRCPAYTDDEAELRTTRIADAGLEGEGALDIAPCEVAADTIAQEVHRVNIVRRPQAATSLDAVEAIDTYLQRRLAGLQHQSSVLIELLILDDLMASIPDERAIPVGQRIAIAAEDGLEAHDTQAVLEASLIEGSLCREHLRQEFLDRLEVDLLPLPLRASTGTPPDKEKRQQESLQ